MSKVRGQVLWNRRLVSVATGTSGPIPHGLSEPSEADFNPAIPFNQRVLALACSLNESLGAANLVGWDRVTSVTNNGDGTFTFLGTGSFDIMVLFIDLHSLLGPGLIDGVATGPAAPTNGQLLWAVAHVGSFVSSVTLASLGLTYGHQPPPNDVAFNKPASNAMLESVMVVPVMGSTAAAGDQTVVASNWAGALVGTDATAQAITFSGVSRSSVRALFLLPSTMIGPTNADNWDAGAGRVPSLGTIAAPPAPGGQLLLSRENLQLAQGALTHVNSVRQQNAAYDPNADPDLISALNIVPLAPLDGWLAGDVGHFNPASTGAGQAIQTDFEASQGYGPLEVNVMFWEIHTAIGPGAASPGVYSQGIG